LNKLADGAKHRVVIFEYNAGNHSHRRALANAAATIWVQRDGRLPVVTSANCLQPYRQNDNGWDQGLLFLNPSQVWLQPPGYVTQMISRNYLPLVLKCESSAPDLDVCATKSEDGKTLVLEIVNATGKPVTLPLKILGFVLGKPVAKMTRLEGELNARNTPGNPHAIKPTTTEWKHGLQRGETSVTCPRYSFTVIRF
jgi:alpha-L-arabinofuranosidase